MMGWKITRSLEAGRTQATFRCVRRMRKDPYRQGQPISTAVMALKVLEKGAGSGWSEAGIAGRKSLSTMRNMMMKGQEKGAIIRKHGMKAGRKIQNSGQIAGLAEKFAHAGKNPKQLGRCQGVSLFFHWMFPTKKSSRMARSACLISVINFNTTYFSRNKRV